MTKIKGVGQLCKVNEHGCIINESDIDNIRLNLQDVVQSVKESYLAFIPEEIHSIYIRGSWPRGLGIEGVSDLDAIAVTYSDPASLDLRWVEEAEQMINDQYPQIRGVEMAFYSINDVIETDRFAIIPFMIKTHSICVHGENVMDRLPDYKADQTLANEHIVKIRLHVDQAKRDLEGNEDIEDILDCCQWIMKMIVRCGGALVLMEERTYTRDLFPAFQLFVKHYPEQEEQMRKALEYAIEPVVDTEKLLKFLHIFGAWMIHEAENWLKQHNPEKEINLTLET